MALFDRTSHVDPVTTDDATLRHDHADHADHDSAATSGEPNPATGTTVHTVLEPAPPAAADTDGPADHSPATDHPDIDRDDAWETTGRSDADSPAVDSSAVDSTAADSTATDSAPAVDLEPTPAAGLSPAPALVPTPVPTPEPARAVEPAPEPSSEDDTARWREVMASFVDSPADAVSAARTLVSEELDRVVRALNSERDRLDSAGDGGDSTEDLRVTLQGYRNLADRLHGIPA